MQDLKNIKPNVVIGIEPAKFMIKDFVIQCRKLKEFAYVSRIIKSFGMSKYTWEMLYDFCCIDDCDIFPDIVKKRLKSSIETLTEKVNILAEKMYYRPMSYKELISLDTFLHEEILDLCGDRLFGEIDGDYSLDDMLNMNGLYFILGIYQTINNKKLEEKQNEQLESDNVKYEDLVVKYDDLVRILHICSDLPQFGDALEKIEELNCNNIPWEQFCVLSEKKQTINDVPANEIKKVAKLITEFRAGVKKVVAETYSNKNINYIIKIKKYYHRSRLEAEELFKKNSPDKLSYAEYELFYTITDALEDLISSFEESHEC